jgi:hypothetical protein
MFWNLDVLGLDVLGLDVLILDVLGYHRVIRSLDNIKIPIKTMLVIIFNIQLHLPFKNWL